MVLEGRRISNNLLLFMATGFPCERQQRSLHSAATYPCVIHLENPQTYIWRFVSISYPTQTDVQAREQAFLCLEGLSNIHHSNGDGHLVHFPQILQKELLQ